MGAILDSTFLISAERRGLSVAAAIEEARRLSQTDHLAVSVVTIMELAHGQARADTPQRAANRNEFLEQLTATVQVLSLTPPIARRAGLISGDLSKQGILIAFPDLIIGVTALEHGFSVITGNIRHFESIPDIKLITH